MPETSASPEAADVATPDVPAALERLRQSVAAAAREIGRLRAENERLSAESERLGARVRELEEAPGAALDDGTVLALDRERDALRAQIERSIEAVDYYLAQAPPPEASPRA